MEKIWDILYQYHIISVLYAMLLLFTGYFVARLLSSSLTKPVTRKLSPHSAMLIQRATFYLLFILFIATAIQQLGFQIGTLLGAAGILTAAVGFASQTSMSNVISGLFIIGEKPFAIGDTIKVNEFQGQVSSLDLLSVKIRTNDNTMVRIPNEVLIKSAIVNLSYFPWRRIDLKLSVSYQESFTRVKSALLAVVENNSLCLKDPAPSVQIENFIESAMEIQFSVWVNQVDFSQMKNTILEDIQKSFLSNDIPLWVPIRVCRQLND